MLSCDIHDYVEIACTYQFAVTLTLESGEIIKGKAIDTCLNTQRQECLKLLAATGEVLVELLTVISMQAKEKNPHFDIVSFR